jgi:heme/copper-type cytochrome/quinol oxidase subunit 3
MSEAAVAGSLPSGSVTSSETRRDLQAFVFIIGAGLFVVIGSLLSIYIDARNSSLLWPPKGVYLNNYSGVMITITLLMGSATAEWAARSARDEERGVIGGLLFTTAFGVAALNAIGFLFHGLGFGISDHVYGTLIYALLIVMTIAISGASLVCLANGIRSINERFDGGFRERIRATASMWHLIVVSWLVVYTVIYLVK